MEILFICEESVCSLGQKENSIEGFVTIFFNLLYSKYLLCQTRDFLLGFNLSWVIGAKKHPFLEGKVYSTRESCPSLKLSSFLFVLLFDFFFFFLSFSHCPALFRKEKVEGRILAIMNSSEERGAWGDRVDGLTDAAVLNSHNLGMIKTDKAVPRQVLRLYFCKVLWPALSEP